MRGARCQARVGHGGRCSNPVEAMAVVGQHEAKLCPTHAKTGGWVPNWYHRDGESKDKHHAGSHFEYVREAYRPLGCSAT